MSTEPSALWVNTCILFKGIIRTHTSVHRPGPATRLCAPFQTLLYNKVVPGFPGGPMVKNQLCTSSVPGPGRSHMPWSNYTCEPQLLSPRSGARQPQLLKPVCLEPVLCNQRSHSNEKPVYHNQRVAMLITTREGLHSNRNPPQRKLNTQILKKEKKKPHGSSTCKHVLQSQEAWSNC